MALTLDDTFVANISALTDDSANAADAEQNQDLRQWYLADIGLWSGDTLDIYAISDAFARDDVGLDYSETLTNGDGTTGEAAGCKLQSDYLAVIERAFRIRHASPIRSRAQAASRRLGHGDPNGCITQVLNAAQDFLTDGQTSDPE